jgi:hypothetical protein
VSSAIASKKPKIEAPSRSPLLARLATFIPSIHSANAELQRSKSPQADAFTLEEIPDELEEHQVARACVVQASDSSGGEEAGSLCTPARDAIEDESHPQHIEMKLTCGLLDLQNSAACSAAELAMQAGSTEDARQPSLEAGQQLAIGGTTLMEAQRTAAWAPPGMAASSAPACAPATAPSEQGPGSRARHGRDSHSAATLMCVSGQHKGGRSTGATAPPVQAPGASRQDAVGDDGRQKRPKVEVINSCDTE